MRSFTSKRLAQKLESSQILAVRRLGVGLLGWRGGGKRFSGMRQRLGARLPPRPRYVSETSGPADTLHYEVSLRLFSHAAEMAELPVARRVGLTAKLCSAGW
jgi:hypothetical protein